MAQTHTRRMHRNRPESSGREGWTPRSPFLCSFQCERIETLQSSSGALTLRNTGNGRCLFPKLSRLQAKHDALAIASPTPIIEPESNRKYGRFIPGWSPTRQFFGNNLTRVAVWTRHLPDASGLVNHRSGEGHETYLFSIAECA